MRIRTMLALLLLHCLVQPTLGAEPLSLEECLRRALANGPGLGQALVRVEQAKTKLDEARSKSNFSFDWKAAFGVVPNDDDGNGLGPFMRNELSFTQPLWTFGKLKAGKQAAEGGILAAEEQMRIDRHKLIFEVSRLYFLTLLATELSDLAGETKDRLDKALKKAQELFDQGSPKVTQKDLAKLKIFNAKLSSQTLSAKTGVEMARSALATACGLDGAEQLDLGEARLKAPEIQLDALEHYRELGMARRPELAALQRGIAAKDALARLEKKKFLPDLAVVGTLKYSFAPERTIQSIDPSAKDDFNVFNYGAAFGMRLALGLREQAVHLRQARLEVDALRAQLHFAEAGIGLEIEKAYRDALEAQERVRVTREGLKAARGWMIGETQLYQLGTSETKDLLESLGAYAEAKKDSLDAIQKFLVSLAELRRVTGEEPQLEPAQASDSAIQPPPSTSSPR